MILVDFSAVMYSVVHISDPENGLDENLFRHKLLATILSFKKKFENKYGEIILCMDAAPYWRRQYFEFYKHGRKKAKEESKIDWDAVNKVTDKITQEFINFLPWKFIHVTGAEGDDVIATLCKAYPNDRHLIMSRDKDFVQLQVNPNIEQYSPVTKTWMVSKDPVRDLKELIIRGDVSDGIPNIYSPAESFYTKTRQKTLTENRLNECMSCPDLEKTEFKDRWIQNRTLIDFSFIPDDVSANILTEFDIPPKGSQSLTYKYFVSNRMNQMMSSLPDIVVRNKGTQNAIRTKVGTLDEFFG